MSKHRGKWNSVLVICILICVFMAVPYLINYLVNHNGLPFSSSLSGTNEFERTWLVFWASYVGCVFSSIVTFIVLFLTLRQNDKQNRENREDAHQENQLVRDSQENMVKYERALLYVSEIRSFAANMYHSVVNCKAEEIYSSIALDRIKDIDMSVIRTRLLEIQDDMNRAYIEMQLLLSYGSEHDDESDKVMNVIKTMSDSSYDSIRDLIWFLIECKHTLSANEEAITAEVYKYASEHSDRIKLPDHKYIWEIIIENNSMDITANRFEIVSKWHDEWNKINQLYLVSLSGLVNHYYKKAQTIKSIT